MRCLLLRAPGAAARRVDFAHYSRGASNMTAIVQDRVTTREGVVFGTGGGRELRCDVYEPPAAVKNGIGILLIHGGGWSQGDRSQLKGYGVLLGRRGYTCIASEYRLTGEALWPAQIEDVKCAIRYVRANAAEFGIDPDRLVISGNSAGGHLSLMAGGAGGVAGFEGRAATRTRAPMLPRLSRSILLPGSSAAPGVGCRPSSEREPRRRRCAAPARSPMPPARSRRRSSSTETKMK